MHTLRGLAAAWLTVGESADKRGVESSRNSNSMLVLTGGCDMNDITYLGARERETVRVLEPEFDLVVGGNRIEWKEYASGLAFYFGK